MEDGFKPFNREAGFNETRRNLPHRTQEGCTYFLTWRQADSVPQTTLEEWKRERQQWMDAHPVPWDDKTRRAYEIRFVRRLERWADEGLGSCLLRCPANRELVVRSLHFFDQHRYRLDAFVVMPNHVHVLVKPLPGFSLSGTLHSWKSFSAHEINKARGETGPVWMDETFNHAVRSLPQLERFRRSILDNPSKAHLPTGSFSHWQSCG